MQDPRDAGRREFTLEMALALLAGATITVSGCGGGSSDEPYGATPVPTPQPTPTPTPTPTPEPQPTPTPEPSPTPTPIPARNGVISGNHGHVARITSGQLTAGGAISLDISGSAGHPHTVQLSASEVMAIAEGTRVSTTSSNELAHDHVVTFN